MVESTFCFVFILFYFFIPMLFSLLFWNTASCDKSPLLHLFVMSTNHIRMNSKIVLQNVHFTNDFTNMKKWSLNLKFKLKRNAINRVSLCEIHKHAHWFRNSKDIIYRHRSNDCERIKWPTYQITPIKCSHTIFTFAIASNSTSKSSKLDVGFYIWFLQETPILRAIQFGYCKKGIQ